MHQVTRDFPALRMPNMSALSGVNREVTINAPVSVSQSLAGAVSPEGIAGISRDVAVAVGAQFSKQIRAEFPNLVAKAFRDNL